MKKKSLLNLFNLQLFADDTADSADTSADVDTGADGIDAADDSAEDASEPEKKYTDADLDRIISRRLAKLERKQSEAQKLAEKNAKKTSEDRIAQLESELSEFRAEKARTDMMAVARKNLSGQNLTVSDNLLGYLVTADAESTQENIDEFTRLFNAEVDRKVREITKGTTPSKAKSNPGITKEQIMAIKNTAERQRMIAEHMDLFK
ncbi:MAG: DUF4355 domain-containing protein [Lachnospiraceae bacterium]|nr:DUF4355 domain-containing protein [Lachnospiraceae bacterium]